MSIAAYFVKSAWRFFVRLLFIIFHEPIFASLIYSFGIATIIYDWLSLYNAKTSIPDWAVLWGVVQLIVVLSAGVIKFFQSKSDLFRIFVFLSLILFVTDTVIFFAECYKRFGISGPECANDPFLYLYFSITTWTTVGFGDIVPSAGSRPVAALEPIISYFTMGIMVTLGADLYRKWGAHRQTIRSVKRSFQYTNRKVLFVFYFVWIAFSLYYDYKSMGANLVLTTFIFLFSYIIYFLTIQLILLMKSEKFRTEYRKHSIGPALFSWKEYFFR